MSVNARDLSVVVFDRGLTNLRTVLMKGEAHATANGMQPSELIKASLAPGMYDLAVQVHWAATGARMAIDRILDSAAAPRTEEATTFAELYLKVDTTITYLRTIKVEALEAGLDRTIEIDHRGRTITLAGPQFILQFAIPSFYFHLTTAYGILRHKGVDVTKGDFLGALG